MLKSVKIGNVNIDVPIGLAPLAGISDKTYRNIALEHGAGLVVTEMVSAKAIVYKNKNTHVLLQREDYEHPSAVQLFGSDPDSLRLACDMIRDIPFDIVDFNMGCPVPKVVKNGEGSALLTDLKKAERAVSALVKAARKPVSAKIRIGFDEEHINAVETAKMLEGAGVSAITVHSRTRAQYYSGNANLEAIADVKKAVSVPIFGNGDITDGKSAKKMLDETGCDGIMIGRAAMGNPWIFGQIRYYLDTGLEAPKPMPEDIFKMIIHHAKLLSAANGEYMAMRQMRTHAACYLKGFRCASKLRGQINTIQSIDELRSLLYGLI